MAPCALQASPDRSDGELEPVAVGVEDNALVAAQLASAVRPLEHAVAGRGDDAAEFVDGIGGSEREAEVHKPRRRRVAGRTLAAARPLEQLQADTAEIQHAFAKTCVGVCGKRRGRRPELQVEVAQALGIVRR